MTESTKPQARATFESDLMQAMLCLGIVSGSLTRPELLAEVSVVTRRNPLTRARIELLRDQLTSILDTCDASLLPVVSPPA